MCVHRDILHKGLQSHIKGMQLQERFAVTHLSVGEKKAHTELNRMCECKVYSHISNPRVQIKPTKTSTVPCYKNILF